VADTRGSSTDSLPSRDPGVWTLATTVPRLDSLAAFWEKRITDTD